MDPPTAKKTRQDNSAISHVGSTVFRMPEVWSLLLRTCDIDAAFNLSVVICTDATLWQIARDSGLWEELVDAHFGQKRHFPPAALCPSSMCAPDHRSDKRFGPSEGYIEFVETYAERDLFRKVHVLQGDIGRVQDINSIPLDCIIFPTNYSLRNAGSGAAVAVFRRAGSRLDEYVERLHYEGQEADAVVTPGFDAGVDHLIHCVGPSPHAMGSFALLYRTYLNAFEHARRQNARCIAIASIATGALGFPLGAATTLAMRAFRDFIKTHRWDATLAFVCFDGDVAEAMRAAKAQILDEFNFHCFQVMAIV
ncbi:Aste57867_25546 [Aphanomyces stellatus]|uniref:Aste57867_25546 protein n=1 Tax=Aphanomyces stellatus TaxID=120398 RepID=A0A485LY84_9STRA|nr:hypothetical protein As57867_025467 [Aphanomyces stellatus]VFU02169.1 Aste57867_25546 [Aphanomyces stellatus]